MKLNKQFWIGIIVGVVCTALICGTTIAFIYTGSSPLNQVISSSEDEGFGDEALNFDTILKNAKNLEQLIDDYFILDYNKSDIEQGLYKGMIAALNDPYSVYYSPSEASKLIEDMTGSYCGMGATISENADGDIIIVKVFKNSPAEKAGVQAGDVIIGIDNESVSGYSTDDVVSLAHGEEGTTFVLNTKRDGERIDYNITREAIQVEKVTYSITGNIGYISINQFVGTADEEVEEALKELKNQGATKLVIDVRNNLGGTLDVLLNIAEYFLDEGETIIKEVDKKGNSSTRSATSDKLFDGPIVILTNGYTASAAEVFTAALHDNGKAEVVGTQTYGKGIVQQSIPLSTGAIVKLTTEYYYTPNDVCIHKIGITPDYVLEYDASSSGDNQLAKAMEILEQK